MEKIINNVILKEKIMNIKVANKKELSELTIEESKKFGYECAISGKDISYDPFRNLKLKQSHSQLANAWIEGFKNGNKEKSLSNVAKK
tara:strand:+ start:25900 stop:26163 length:264 start_codon:yes stop_codon:yes gene_type:complete